jgi:hypothetical protein
MKDEEKTERRGELGSFSIAGVHGVKLLARPFGEHLDDCEIGIGHYRGERTIVNDMNFANEEKVSGISLQEAPVPN